MEAASHLVNWFRTIARPAGATVAAGDLSETARHAATLAFDILSAPEAAATELASSLSFVTDRIGGWIRTGDRLVPVGEYPAYVGSGDRLGLVYLAEAVMSASDVD